MHNSSTNWHGVVLGMTMILIANVVNGTREVEIGVILDMDSKIGKSIRICMLMALEEVYGAQHMNNFTTIIRCHFRDSGHNNFQAASAAIDLLKNTQVVALLGPQQSSQANFVLELAYISKVPIISPATSPDLTFKLNPYFIRIAHNSSTQAEPIAALIKSFGWTEVVFVYEDTDFGREPIPYLLKAMLNIGTQVKYQALLSPSSMDDSILQQLEKLKTMPTRVFVVHMLPAQASRFFKKAYELEMMAHEYVWIITDVLTGLLQHLNPQDLDYMQGVLGVKPYIPPSNHLTNFERKWRRRVLTEYPEIDIVEVDMFGIWSYDFIYALATSLQIVESNFNNSFRIPKKGSTDMAAIITSEMRTKILPMIQNIKLKGLSGDFHVVNGQLQTLDYQIVNVVGKGEKHVGFWNLINGLSNQLSNNQSLAYTTNKGDLGAIIWPGDTPRIPKGFDNNKLRVGVPSLTGFVEFFEAYRDPVTNIVFTNGFCMDVFNADVNAMSYEIISYETPTDEIIQDTNDLVYHVVLRKFDMDSEDVGILWNRSSHVDFSFPFLKAGFEMLGTVKFEERVNAWYFIEPFKLKLWITIGVLFICTGLVVWVLEHRVNSEFRGSHYHQQVLMVFSNLFFGNNRSINNLSTFVVKVWLFVTLLVSITYTINVSSILWNQRLQSNTRSINELIARGNNVGYQGGSFVEGLLENIGGFPDDHKLKKYNNLQEYEVATNVEGIPYLMMLQAKHYSRYLIVAPTYKTAGFAFAFPEGSPHVATFSRAILKVVEHQMRNTSHKWLAKENDCPGGVCTFKLTLASFQGLIIISSLASICALVVNTTTFLHENEDIISSNSMYQKMSAHRRRFNEIKGESLYEAQVINVNDTRVLS